MRGKQVEPQNDPAVAAIERVLKVERDGVQQMQHTQEHARHLQSQAGAQAAAIAQRADARISQLHNTYLQKVQREIEGLAQSTLSSDEHADNAYDRVTLVQAARRVAAKLTGGA